MENPYFITGRTDSVFPRLEIRDLEKNKEQFTLFIHALSTIMLPEHRPKAARFADLGGIHGLPYERWIGDPNVPDYPAAGTYGGYCNHGSVLFPNWHRPYILALEQSIGEVAVRLARRWTANSPELEKALWENAAKELRLPFWDWTAPSTGKDGLPDVLQPQTFIFALPGGATSDPIDNPLAFFEFGSRIPDGFTNLEWKTPLAPTGTSFFKDWRRTYRWPSSKEHPIEDYIRIKQILVGKESQRGSWIQLRNQVANLFTFPASVDNPDEYPTIWDEFSNTTFQSKGRTPFPPHNKGSIEAPHNSVHLVLGGLGSMANNDYAGFDPIFYLHHCNIDRLLAFWEYAYADYWMGEGYKDINGKLSRFTQDDGTWAEDDGADLTQTTSLEPFRKGDNAYWDANDTRFLQRDLRVKKGYTYPPITDPSLGTVSVDAPLPSTLTERERTIRILQNHFSIAEPTGLIPISPPPDRPKIIHPIFTHPKEISTLPRGHVRIDNFRHFAIEVQLIAHAFNGSYLLELLHRNELIGSFAVLSRGDHTKCAACKARREAGGHVRGIINIPHDIIATLITESGLNKADATPEELVDYLKEHFTVRLVGPSGALLAEVVVGEHTESSGERHRGAPLDKRLIPKLRLLSASAAHPAGRAKDGPIQFFDWIDHDDILPDNTQWKTAQA